MQPLQKAAIPAPRQTATEQEWREAILDKLAEDYPELDLARFTKHDLRVFLKRWEDKSAATRANVVSVLHSFFGWATAEDLIEVDPGNAERIFKI